MRIIGGTHKRRQIIAPAKLPVRPTTDMAKESLFNILNNHFDFEELSVLDLFAGTGNISYEFASRGAREIIAVDQNLHCVQFIKQTAEKLEMEQMRAVKAEAYHFIEICKVRFDLIFADPPFDMNTPQRIAEKIFAHQLLNPNGWLVMEHGPRTDFSKLPHFKEMRHYGKVHFSIFQMPTNND